MACEICEHCQNPVSIDEKVTVSEGFSYHKNCHRCYVCSETNLQKAEVFKGVIFCCSCAQRIFQGCATARRAKTTHAGRVKRPRSRSHRRREKVRAQPRNPDRSRDGVIELAVLAGSTTTDSDEPMKEKMTKASLPVLNAEMALQVGNQTYEQNRPCMPQAGQFKTNSSEMGTSTDVTQEFLRQINYPVPDCKTRSNIHPTTVEPKKQNKKEKIEPHVNTYTRKRPVCSDLRIAELGASTEIANMTLRKKSEVPVIIKSNSKLKVRPAYSISVLHRDSEVSGDGTAWLESTYSTIDESFEKNYKNVMDRPLGSILKLPFRFFKNNILNRSSLISMLMSTDDDQNINIFQRLREMWYREVTEHQGRGLKRLYSTINRRKMPYKLGWVSLVANVKNVTRDDNHPSLKRKGCKHFQASHSYRCMRAQVMRLAGPTNSELACYRNKIKRFIAPQFLRNFVNNNNNYPAIKQSLDCGTSTK